MTNSKQEERIKRRMEEGYENPKKDKWARRERPGHNIISLKKDRPKRKATKIAEEETKVGQNNLKEIKNMPEKNKKLLLFLPADKLWGRIIRRGIVVAVLTFVVVILKDWIIPTSPEVLVAVFSAVLVAADKAIRDLTGK
jgi:hypothetical protein